MLMRWNDFGNLARFRGRESARASDPFDALRREMNHLFFDFERGYPGASRETSGSWPRATLEDTGAAFVVRAELPGVEDKALELSAEQGSLTIKGERKDTPPEGYSAHRKERTAFRFSRSFALPAKVDVDGVQAVLKNGVLTVTLPKAKEAQPRQISVKAS
jgi:HSP20 family protein